MNEPKRRGRPPIERAEPTKEYPVQDAAIAYAKNVWHGQSIDLPYKVRLDRVYAALDAQGLSKEGITQEALDG